MKSKLEFRVVRASDKRPVYGAGAHGRFKSYDAALRRAGFVFRQDREAVCTQALNDQGKWVTMECIGKPRRRRRRKRR